MTEQIRAAGYVRVSTDEQANEGISVADQVRRIVEYIAAQGWELAGMFVDAGVSGSIPFAERPEGAKAFAADVDVIVVIAWDRLGRDAADFLAVVRDRRVESISEAGEPPLLCDLKAVLAQEERRKIAERAARAAVALAEEGRYNGPRPCGYTFKGVKKDSRLARKSTEVPIVLRVFAEYIAGTSLRKIAKGLNADDVPTVRGGLWREATVKSILSNPVYVGKVRHQDKVYPGKHRRIFDENKDPWKKAQELLAAIQARPSRGRGRPPAGSHLFVGGMLRCGTCGEAMVPRTIPRKVGTYEQYICNGSMSYGPEFCSRGAVKRELIDCAVYDFFEHVGLDEEATRQQLADERNSKLNEIRALRSGAEREAQKAAERLARVRGHYQDGKLDPDDWNEQRQQLTGELAAATAQAERLTASEEEIERDEVVVDAEAETLANLAAIREAVAGEVKDAEGVAAVRAALARLFDRFTLHPRTGAKFRKDPDAPSQAPLLDVADDMIEVWIRPQVLEGYAGVGVPVLRREPLGQTGNKSRKGVGQRCLLKPIPIELNRPA